MNYIYHNTKEETEDTDWEESLGKLFIYQCGCESCGGSFDVDYGGETNIEPDMINICGYCLDKGVTA